jgi:hypothetical protein
VAVVIVCSTPACGDSTVSKSVDEILQKQAKSDGSESFTVRVTCIERTALVNIDHDEGWVDNLKLEVQFDTPQKGGSSFEMKFPKTWHAIDFGAAWRRGLIQTDVALPSGRVFWDESSGETLFVLFDGDQMQLFKLDHASMKFTPTDPKPFAQALKRYYLHAFDPSDLNWCYGLVRCAPFFGMTTAATFKPGENLTSEELLKLWHEAKE